MDERRFPVEERLVETAPGTRILVQTQQPGPAPHGSLYLLHGLEGSSQAGYMRSMAQSALEAGYTVHRLNMRSCGGSVGHCETMYHAGLTDDLRFLLEEGHQEGVPPAFLVGYSLGGNVVLKLAGELGDDGPRLLAGVCAVSAPIDLQACVEAIERPSNAIYNWRFVTRLRERGREWHRSGRTLPCTLDELDQARSVLAFDDVVTARAFGFGSAANYYRTQSARNFLGRIQVPALVIAAQDDPMIPFTVYDHPAFLTNPNLRLLAVKHGGHLGFVARHGPRFWVDGVILDWVKTVQEAQPAPANRQPAPSRGTP